MKRVTTDNQMLLDVLTRHNVTLICSEQMDILINDDQEQEIMDIVQQYAPAAAEDISIEKI